MPVSSLRIIVTGLVGLCPVGGVAWDYLQYVLGLARLGHDVVYHEDTWTWPYDPTRNTVTDRGEYSARVIGDFFARYAPHLGERWHYLHLHETSFGMTRRAFSEFARSADLLINVSGSCMLPDDLRAGCTKVFLDTDPGYNQVLYSERFSWSENIERWCASVDAHDRHFTYAENIHGHDCLVPRLRFDWQTTRMPIVMALWDTHPCPTPRARGSWSTVMTWNAFKGPVTWNGMEYRSKGAEFERIIELPVRVGVPLAVALGGEGAPRERLAAHGWDVVDAPAVTLTPERYRTFVSGSRGEVSTAKHIYVAMRTGWFSCRSACYLAAGRPVVVQDTGFSSHLPVGEGILPFSTLDEAADSIEAVEGDYERHARAAREVAAAAFDSDRVLGDLVAAAFAPTPRHSPATAGPPGRERP